MPEDPVCGNPTLLPGYPVLSAPEEVSHVMDGIPLPLWITGVVLIILFSHLLVSFGERRHPGLRYSKFNLFRFPFLKQLVRKPQFPLLAQSVSLFLLLLVISAGLFGRQHTNIAPVLTWTWWWILLVFLILGFGKVFCAVCPWEATASLVTSLSLESRIKKLGFEYSWPVWARNIFPAMVFFIILTWFELGQDVTRSPSMTALLALCMLAMAVLSALFFERRGFCRYGCLVGRISGLYALFSPLELRPQSGEICRQCTGKACFRGTDRHTGCPTMLFPGKLKESTYCTLCTECVRSCPHDNIAINVRPMGADLFHTKKFRWDEAILAIVLLALTSFHGVTMTPLWTRMNALLRVETGLGPTLVFTVLMVVMLALPLLLFWVGADLARRFTGGTQLSTAAIFKASAYSLIPIALFYHLAHNCMHFFMEAQNLIPLLSDPFGFGWDLFGTASKHYGPILSLSTIWHLQVGCVVVGHVYGVLIADRIARDLFPDPRMVWKSLIPLLVTMILYSSFSMWLIAQPMEMRTGM